MKRLMITTALVASLISFGYAQDRPERTRTEGQRSERPRVEGQRSERPRMQGQRLEKAGRERQLKTPQERAKFATDALEKKLNLSPDQKTKVYALNLERAQKMDKTMKSEREFRKAQMEKHKSFREESDKKLSKILNADQQKSYEEMKKQSHDKMKSRRPQDSRNRGK